MQLVAGLEAVTVDGYGTLVELADPVGALQAALEHAGHHAEGDRVRDAFHAEVRYYRPRSHEGSDKASLARLRHDCVAVFLEELGVSLEPDSFVEAFMEALDFGLVPGASAALEELRAAGLRLACVANWDVGLHAELERLDVSECFDVILTSADVGSAKPAPLIFERALTALDVAADRALHIGDEAVDEQGAAAAGMHFEPVPISTLPARLGLAS